MTSNGFAEKGPKVFALVHATSSAKVINSGCLEAKGRLVSWSLPVANVETMLQAVCNVHHKVIIQVILEQSTHLIDSDWHCRLEIVYLINHGWGKA